MTDSNKPLMTIYQSNSVADWAGDTAPPPNQAGDESVESKQKKKKITTATTKMVV